MKIKMKQQNVQKKMLKEAFKEFVIYCRVRNLSSETNSFYEECYNGFIKFYPETKIACDITNKVIEGYFFELKKI